MGLTRELDHKMAPVAKEASYRVYEYFDVDVVRILYKGVALQPLRKVSMQWEIVQL